MKKRLLAAMLTASLAISTTPAQAFSLTGWFLRKKVFNNETFGNGAEKFADAYENQMEKSERILAILGLLVGTYFLVDYTMKTGSDKKVSLFESILGLLGHFGFKSERYKEKTEKGQKFVEEWMDASGDQKFDQTIEGIKKAATNAKNEGKNALRKGVKVAKKVGQGAVDSIKELGTSLKGLVNTVTGKDEEKKPETTTNKEVVTGAGVGDSEEIKTSDAKDSNSSTSTTTSSSSSSSSTSSDKKAEPKKDESKKSVGGLFGSIGNYFTTKFENAGTDLKNWLESDSKKESKKEAKSEKKEENSSKKTDEVKVEEIPFEE